MSAQTQAFGFGGAKLNTDYRQILSLLDVYCNNIKYLSKMMIKFYSY